MSVIVRTHGEDVLSQPHRLSEILEFEPISPEGGDRKLRRIDPSRDVTLSPRCTVSRTEDN